MPFGQMPTLEINGKVYHQSMAMARYLAKQVKLDGSNDLENMEIDIAVDVVNDLRSKMAMFFYEQDAKIKAEKEQTVRKETIPYYLERLNKSALENNGHLACGKVIEINIHSFIYIFQLLFMFFETLLISFDYCLIIPYIF